MILVKSTKRATVKGKKPKKILPISSLSAILLVYCIKKKFKIQNLKDSKLKFTKKKSKQTFEKQQHAVWVSARST